MGKSSFELQKSSLELENSNFELQKLSFELKKSSFALQKSSFEFDQSSFELVFVTALVGARVAAAARGRDAPCMQAAVTPGSQSDDRQIGLNLFVAEYLPLIACRHRRS